MKHLFLRLSGQAEIPLGAVVVASDIPELLRHVADYYDDNPDACADFLAGSPPGMVPRALADPFAAY